MDFCANILGDGRGSRWYARLISWSWNSGRARCLVGGICSRSRHRCPGCRKSKLRTCSWGIDCEEIVYRGFLIRYFMGTPRYLAVSLAMIASNGVFGPGHIYQGAKGAIATTILGMVFAILFVTTGRLWAPIVLHALMDARLLLMIDEGQSLEPAAQT